jgi:hypothetical protein
MVLGCVAHPNLNQSHAAINFNLTAFQIFCPTESVRSAVSHFPTHHSRKGTQLAQIASHIWRNEGFNHAKLSYHTPHDAMAMIVGLVLLCLAYVAHGQTIPFSFDHGVAVSVLF